MNIKRSIGLAVIFLALLGLVGCGYGTTKVGWVGNKTPGHWSASFASFSGTDAATISLDEGYLLRIEYESEIEEGSFEIQIADPDGEKVAGIEINEKGVKEIVARESGRYRLILKADKAKGRFSFSW